MSLLIYLEQKTISPFNILLFLFGLVFFRILDDYFCQYRDLIDQKKHFYLAQSTRHKLKSALVILGIVFFIFLSVFIMSKMSLWIILFTVLSIVLYKLLDTHFLVNFVSLLKYPFFYLLSLGIDKSENYLWASLVLMAFIGVELSEKTRVPQYLVKPIVFGGLAAIKFGLG
jgi:hypothetical protein